MMRKILLKIQKKEEAFPFLYPVDFKELKLNDYPNIVKSPMDLCTVKAKIPSYTSIESFKNDLQLIWDNCKLYNNEESV